MVSPQRKIAANCMETTIIFCRFNAVDPFDWKKHLFIAIPHNSHPSQESEGGVLVKSSVSDF
jgi:hypothetical protein